MNAKPLVGLVVPVLLLALSVSGAYAVGQQSIRTQVDFSFVVNNRELPSGEYLVERIDQKDPSAMRITNLQTRETVNFLTEPLLTSENGPGPRLTFRVANGKHYLANVWLPDMVIGQGLLRQGLLQTQVATAR